MEIILSALQLFPVTLPKVNLAFFQLPVYITSEKLAANLILTDA